MKKKAIYGIVCVAIICVLWYTSCYNKVAKVYTYDELNSLSALELYELFVDNGLVVNDEYKNIFSSKEEFARFFKAEFPLLHQGYTSHNYTIHVELATETKRIYDQLVK